MPQADPSGAYFGWKASAIGKNFLNAKSFLEKRYNDEMELDDAIHTVSSQLVTKIFVFLPRSDTPLLQVSYLMLYQSIAHNMALVLEKRYNGEMELDDAIHTVSAALHCSSVVSERALLYCCVRASIEASHLLYPFSPHQQHFA
jgi:Proteasome subunit